MKKNILFLCLVCLVELLSAQNIFMSTSSQQLWKTNPNTCTSTLVGTTPQNFLDIAFLPNGKLYGQHSSGIYEIDTTNASSTLVLATPNATGNSLGGGANGRLYAVDANDDLLEINMVNLTITNKGQVNCVSSGDLAFFQGELYLTCTSNNLLKIDINNPTASFSVGTVSITGKPFGLINMGNFCVERPFVISDLGDIYTLDYSNGASTFYCSSSIPSNLTVYGAASVNEALNGLPTNILPSTAEVCPNQSIVIDATTSGASYLWSDGSTNATLTVSQAGSYWVGLIQPGCDTIRDTIQVTLNTDTPTSLGNDTTICIGQSLVLNAFSSSATYLWNNGTTQPTLTVNTPGTYWVDITTTCEVKRDSIVVSSFSQQQLNLGNDQTLCAGDSYTLDATINNANYVWQDNSTNPLYTVTQSGLYFVTATTNCQSLKDSVVFVFEACASILELPNVFSPNKDGANDVFKPTLIQNVSNTTLSIYNRWGSLLYTTSDVTKGWDGYTNGNVYSEGVYYWIVVYTDINGEEQKKNGTVTLFH